MTAPTFAPDGPITAVIRERHSRLRSRVPASGERATPALLGWLSVLCAASTAFALVDAAWSFSEWWVAIVYAAGVAVGEVAVGDRPRVRTRVSPSPAATIMAAAVVWHPGPWLIVGACGGALLGALARRDGLVPIVWAVSRDGVCAALAVTLTGAHDSPLWGAAAGALVGNGLRYVLRALEAPDRFDPALAMQARLAPAYQMLMATTFGMIGGQLALLDTAWIPAVVVLAFPSLNELRRLRIAAATVEALEVLVARSQRWPRQDAAAALELAADAAALAFPGQSTRVCVTQLVGGTQRQATRGHDGTPTDAALLPVAPTGAPLSASTASGRAFITTLGPPDHPLAVMEVTWTGKPRRTRSLHEQVAADLADLASRWLVEAHLRERADAAQARAESTAITIADLAQASDDTRQALSTLREVSRRVGGLAATGPADRSKLVADLDQAGQALASLVGLVTAAAEPSGQAPESVGDTPLTSAPTQALPEGRPARVPLGHLEPS